MTRGKFIVVEGGDGTGKGTCLEYLQQKLVGQPVIFTQEPGGTEIGQEIRETLLRHREETFEPLAELFLFAASRAQHVGQKIKPALDGGTPVVCDRFAASSFAYQIYGNEREELIPIFHLVHEPILALATPDLYILLDLDPAIAEERMRGRGAKNRLDQKERAYHQRVRQGYLDYLHDKKHVMIDASQSPAQVKEAVWQAAAKLIYENKN